MAELSEESPSILHGNEKLDDLGLLDTQPGFIEGQGLIFLQPNYMLIICYVFVLENEWH